MNQSHLDFHLGVMTPMAPSKNTVSAFSMMKPCKDLRFGLCSSIISEFSTFASGGIHHCKTLRLLRVTQGYPEYSFMCNPPLITVPILLAFHCLF